MQLSPNFYDNSLLRVSQIVGSRATKTKPAVAGLLPISPSTWWAGVRSGRFPQPTRGLGSRITAWRFSDIRPLIEVIAPKADV